MIALARFKKTQRTPRSLQHGGSQSREVRRSGKSQERRRGGDKKKDSEERKDLKAKGRESV